MVSKEKTFRKIILIDDDYISTSITKMLLCDLDLAIDIIAFQHATEALSFIKVFCMDSQASQPACPDLIILDLHMPLMDGYEFLSALQGYSKMGLIQVAVVVLSVSDTYREKAALQAYTIYKYLHKPITEEKIYTLSSDTILLF